jgi:2-polyprenyl-3-methyl-5-hydroxy-6-metoxy-1,4-benzoquinol methylase
VRLCLLCRAPHDAADWKCPACGWQPRYSDGLAYFAPELCRGDGTDAAYLDRELLQAEESHFWFRSRSRLIVWALGRYFPEASTLLDVGCGRGVVLDAISRAFPDMRVSGSELLERSLQHARRRLHDASLYQMDARQLPFDRDFAVVTSCDVLEHLDNDEAVVDGMFRAVAPGGGLIVTVPQHPWLWSAVDDFSHHRRRYSRSGLTRIVTRAGFAVERVTSFVSLLLPVVAISRLTRRIGNGTFDPAAELRIGGRWNRVLAGALDIERMVIRCGASLPIGSSLLLVARRPVPS